MRITNSRASLCWADPTSLPIAAFSLGRRSPRRALEAAGGCSHCHPQSEKVGQGGEQQGAQERGVQCLKLWPAPCDWEEQGLRQVQISSKGRAAMHQGCQSVDVSLLRAPHGGGVQEAQLQEGKPQRLGRGARGNVDCPCESTNCQQIPSCTTASRARAKDGSEDMY